MNCDDCPNEPSQRTLSPLAMGMLVLWPLLPVIGAFIPGFGTDIVLFFYVFNAGILWSLVGVVAAWLIGRKERRWGLVAWNGLFLVLWSAWAVFIWVEPPTFHI